VLAENLLAPDSADERRHQIGRRDAHAADDVDEKRLSIVLRHPLSHIGRARKYDVARLRLQVWLAALRYLLASVGAVADAGPGYWSTLASVNSSQGTVAAAATNSQQRRRACRRRYHSFFGEGDKVSE
jgi:hypothetical protein